MSDSPRIAIIRKATDRAVRLLKRTEKELNMTTTARQELSSAIGGLVFFGISLNYFDEMMKKGETAASVARHELFKDEMHRTVLMCAEYLASLNDMDIGPGN